MFAAARSASKLSLPMALRDEILEQPDAAARLLAAAPSTFAAVAAVLRERRPRFAVIAARGSSDNAALYAQYLFGVRNQLAVALATPSAITLYGATPNYSEALVIGISQSGRSPDIVAVVDEAHRQGAPTIAITNDTSSPLAAAADHALSIEAGPELATAATKTYTTELLAVALLSGAMDSFSDAENHDLGSMPGLISAALSVEPEARAVAATHSDRTRCVVLGRGFSYATAREWALKLQEMAQLLAVPYSTADFEHGPMALAESGFAVLAVAPSGPSLDAQIEVLERLRDVHGAQLLVVSDSSRARDIDRGLALPAGIPGWLSPVVEIVPAQLYAYHLTTARGLDPDRPRTISKVTETR
jgi:glucosamine--fructose-6-phosphate aminotransferase (isomerizing)